MAAVFDSIVQCQKLFRKEFVAVALCFIKRFAEKRELLMKTVTVFQSYVTIFSLIPFRLNALMHIRSYSISADSVARMHRHVVH